MEEVRCENSLCVCVCVWLDTWDMTLWHDSLVHETDLVIREAWLIRMCVCVCVWADVFILDGGLSLYQWNGKVQFYQHTATHCNTLQHTATHCSVMQCVALRCSVFQLCDFEGQHVPAPLPSLTLWGAVRCGVLQSVVVCKCYFCRYRGMRVMPGFL